MLNGSGGTAPAWKDGAEMPPSDLDRTRLVGLLPPLTDSAKTVSRYGLHGNSRQSERDSENHT